MKVTNIILSIIILLLAIALAVSSFFLYEKREIMVNGWEKLTTTINETAKELDKNSGTSEAAKLTVEELAHENYENLDDKLPIIVRQSKAVIAQRDAMADMFFRIDKLVKAGNDRDSKGYSSLTDYDSRIKNVNSAVEKTVRDRDNNYNKISNIASRYFGVRLQVTDLRRGAANALTPLEKASRPALMPKTTTATLLPPSPNVSAVQYLQKIATAKHQAILWCKKSIHSSLNSRLCRASSVPHRTISLSATVRSSLKMLPSKVLMPSSPKPNSSFLRSNVCSSASPMILNRGLPDAPKPENVSAVKLPPSITNWAIS